MKKGVGLVDLYFHINDLASAVETVGRIHAMRAEKGAVRRIGGQLRGLELIGAAPLA